MNIKTSSAKSRKEIEEAKSIVELAFSQTPDASLEDWLSFEEIYKNIVEKSGVCLVAKSDSGEQIGMIYAQQESPVNGIEGIEKWVVIIAAVIPTWTGRGVGALLLQNLEKIAKQNNVVKMFIYTNKDDDRVINFYKKNGYEDAGWIKDYQYGEGNSAVFLLKYI